jgi:ACS family allantoate permease-like MFS transporter
MSTKEIQAEDKKSPSVEMATMEKRNSVEAGEVSDISEEDIGEPAEWY